jgi:hypothetical protein
VFSFALPFRHTERISTVHLLAVGCAGICSPAGSQVTHTRARRAVIRAKWTRIAIWPARQPNREGTIGKIRPRCPVTSRFEDVSALRGGDPWSRTIVSGTITGRAAAACSCWSSLSRRVWGRTERAMPSASAQPGCIGSGVTVRASSNEASTDFVVGRNTAVRSLWRPRRGSNVVTAAVRSGCCRRACFACRWRHGAEVLHGGRRWRW